MVKPAAGIVGLFSQPIEGTAASTRAFFAKPAKERHATRYAEGIAAFKLSTEAERKWVLNAFEAKGKGKGKARAKAGGLPPPPARSSDLTETSWTPPEWAMTPFRFDGQQRQLSFSGPAGTFAQAQVRWPGIEKCWDGLLNRAMDGVYLKGGSEAVRN